jgi:hypothetical protein
VTRDEAVEVTGMVVNHWATPRWTQGQMEAFVDAIVEMEPDLAVEAVGLASKELQHRPSIAEMHSFVRLARAHRRLSEPDPPPEKLSRSKIPLWVKRWVCARMLYEHMHRPQDMRPFPEQSGYDYPPDVEMMPPDEWVEEAGRITDAKALAAILGRS